MKVAQIAISSNSKVIGFADWNGQITLTSVDGIEHKVIETNFEPGGTRFNLSSSGDAVFTGSYSGKGVSAYNKLGSLLWERKDIKKVQHIVADQNDLLYVSTAAGKTVVLNQADGSNTNKSINANRVFISLLSSDKLFEGDTELVLIKNHHILSKLNKWSFAVLDFLSIDSKAIISMSAGELRCYELALDSNLLWTFLPPTDSHCLSLTYCGKDRLILGILFNYNNKIPNKLIKWNMQGEILGELELPNWDVKSKLSPDSSFLVTSEGQVISTLDSKVMHQLAL